MSCPCCISNYNKGTKTEIKCYFEDCNFSSCKECIRTYLTGTTNEPHCMQCRKKWDLEFTKNALNASFMQKEYREHRKTILADRTISQIQEHYNDAILLSQRRKDNKAILEIQKEIDEINTTIAMKYQKISDIRNRTHKASEVVERRKFVMPCQTNGCRGMLSSAYKCDLCEKFTCAKCFDSIEGDKDAHTCVPENVETADEIRKNTRPCPSCGCRISKIDGCFAENTPILLWNREIKMSQHIEIGDELIGDDGNKRIVEDVCSGQDDLYEIQQNNGNVYVVNSKHTLVLKMTGKNEIIHMTIEEYMKLTNAMKNNFYGFKSNNGINYEKQDVLLEPYMLGLWLGGSQRDSVRSTEDGTSVNSVIATNDDEIREYVNNWCVNNDAELVQESKYKLRIRRKGYSFYNCQRQLHVVAHGKESLSGEKYENIPKSNRTNPFTDLLKKYNLIGNKHIPNEYLFNDRETRLKLLAGIIDTDGHVTKESKGKRVCIIQTGKIFSEQIIYLAKSLGFLVNHQIRERKNCVIFNCEPRDCKSFLFENAHSGSFSSEKSDVAMHIENVQRCKDQYVINISGEKLEEISTILPRKKCANSAPNKDYFKTSISVKKIEFGNYYGWNVNDNHRFILNDFTVVKNCDQMWCIECKTAFSWSKGTVEVGMVHNPHYFQWMRQNGGMPRTDGLPGAGCNDNRLITQLTFIREIFNMLGKSASHETEFLENCKNSGYTMDELRKIMPLIHDNFNTIKETKSCEELERCKRSITPDFFVNFHRFIVHMERVTLSQLNYSIRARNDDNRAIHLYILGEQTREDLSDYLVKRDVGNARDGAHRDILEALIMVGKQILMDLYNELMEIEVDFSWRLINDQLNMLRFVKNRDLTYIRDKMMEFSKFYTVFYLNHKEGIENMYRRCSIIYNKYVRAVNQYAAYSNAEMIKYLMLYNSKKQVYMWDSDIENARFFKFDIKESLVNGIKHFQSELEIYSNGTVYTF